MKIFYKRNQVDLLLSVLPFSLLGKALKNAVIINLLSFFNPMATLPHFGIRHILLKPVLLLLLIVMNLLIGYRGYGQAYAYNHSPQATAKGFWKLRTDHVTRRTIVWFYNGNQELIYKEELARKYLKATKKNIRRLDGILVNLSENKLVASQVKASALQAATNQLPTPTTRVEPAPLVALLPKKSVELRTIAQSSSNSKGVSLWIDNPKKEKVFIGLKEEKVPAAYKQAIQLYYKFTNAPQYNLFLDVSTLPGGEYKLEVITKSKYYFYTVKVYEGKAGNKLSIHLEDN